MLKGRGAQINTTNPFSDRIREKELVHFVGETEIEKPKTCFIPTHPKSILNKMTSPDLPSGYSMNPYQGCEHGCVYCYARNSHTYWGYSAGLDFETKILLKRNAAQLLEQRLKSKKWDPQPIMLSGNTDCYQPIERKEKITRSILEVLLKYKHPVSIITKNALITRDLDLLGSMAKDSLVSVFLTINTIDDDVRKVLEPRASSIPTRLKTLQKLVENKIPTSVMAGPIIPSINDQNILPLVKEVANLGARSVGYTLVRLNGDVGEVFSHWIHQAFPDRADKVLNKIKEIHGGKLNNSTFGNRMKGNGNYADIIHQQFEIARKKYLPNTSRFEYNFELYEKLRNPQLSLF